ncbi:MAG: VanW family protein [Chloroflexota bacterium]
MTTATIPVRPRNLLLSQVLSALVGGVLLFVLLTILMTAAFQLVYWGRVLPGVSVAGVDISGLSIAEAEIKLNQILTYPYNGQIVLRYENQVWVATPAQLGMVFDVNQSVQTAYAVGRRGGPFRSLGGGINAWQDGTNITPIVMFDQRVAYDYLQSVARQLDQPVQEAELSLEGGEVTYLPGQIGRAVNVDATMIYLVVQMQSFQDGEIPLVVEEQVPQILDLSAEATALRNAISAPLTLFVPDAGSGDPGPWVIGQDDVVDLFLIGRVYEDDEIRFEILLDNQALLPLMNQIGREVERGPEDARFIFNDGTLRLDLLVPAVIGRTLDVNASFAAIVDKLLMGQHEIPLEMVFTYPQIRDDATAESLGISELVSTQTTYFRGSSVERMHNIETAASRFHGLLIPPGATFSMGDVLGDVSLDNGYAEALIIYAGRTITGVGGGVCQVSTTLFRTAFFGGFPIVERSAHAYRVYYYEQSQNGYDPTLAGLDATVYVPLVDLKFVNDTPSWLLMEVYVNRGARWINWKFYSTSDGRYVNYTTTGPQDVVAPPTPLIEEDPDLEAGIMKQVDWAAEGANVTVVRTVYRNGEVYFTDRFVTHYEPWQAICHYGPGTENPVGLARDLDLCQP